ncbi:hypothetical protein [Vibrio amylolyticus]|uniref:rolling circle replication-associated protein n=1 Tax=Vibrio amylolyticus TaxID=2847292 RepID=UPI003550850E
MKTNDLLYVAGAVMPLDQIKRNEASHDAGFLPSKIHTDQEQALLDSGVFKNIPVYDRVIGKKSKRELDILERTNRFKALNFRPKHFREAAARIAEGYSLVKGRKSPTRYMRIWKDRQTSRLKLLDKTLRPKVLLSSPEAYFNHESLYDSTGASKAKILNQNGRRAKGEPDKVPISMQLMSREWNNSFKFQAITQTPSSAAPSANCGERYTKKLTSRSVSRIFEAAAYCSTKHGGFSTFLTLTFTKDQRLALFGGMTDGEQYVSAEAHHPIQYKRNMVTKRARRGEKKVWDTITDIGGEYWTIPTKESPKPKVMNRGGVIAGEYCDIKNKPKQAFTMEKTLETSIGKEVSRFLDGSKKMYQRGWLATHTVEADPESGAPYSKLEQTPVPKYVEQSDLGPMNTVGDFHYIWVAECPANEDGEPNPHVHVLLRWNVPKPLFSAWSKRLEKIWGHGFAKLEKIRKPKAAGSYIIKAVGYAAKGGGEDQGIIKGNRYSIASCSRAPAWECLASFDADNMTAIIKELGHKLEQWRKPIKRQINKLNAAKAQTIKAQSIARQANKPEDYRNKLYQRAIRLEKQAEKLNKKLKSRGVHVSCDNRFCITFEGDDARQKVDKFMLWAAGARGWPLHCRDVDMADIKLTADEQYHDHFIQFQDKRSYWKSVLDENRQVEELGEAELSYLMANREEYAAMYSCELQS